MNVESDIKNVCFVAKKSKELFIKTLFTMDVCNTTGKTPKRSPMMVSLYRVTNTGFRTILLKDGETKSYTKIYELN